ncbi:hypothetical protein NC661_07555 [Aquibacillus koreensis]|uniref:Uncharacterized protein n=1 Tax=Aquibacillus koreensis TaxID=279446 RepID=A0A9X3WKC2_9BACI|nr:hypothetical protein [Aquibacillus koreensis]MCT2535769.1 hypothetical protein [Aquibacillus koreensis]MDC3420225.1 hypothetical protein [Aquibacillus koreensis]
MNEAIRQRKTYVSLSLVCFLLGILSWLPNFLFQYGFAYWMLTFIINPIGIVFGVFGKSKFCVILNVIMTFSFFIFMFVGSIIEAFVH